MEQDLVDATCAVTRDLFIAVAFGRPLIINLDDCDVETLDHDDFIDQENGCVGLAVHLIRSTYTFSCGTSSYSR